MKKMLLIIGLGASLAFTTNGFAYTPPPPGVVTGPYVGLSAGFGGMDTMDLGPFIRDLAIETGTNSQQRWGLTYSVLAGYLFNFPGLRRLKIGAEIGYNSYQASKYQIGDYFFNIVWAKWSYTGYNVDLLAVIKFYLGDFNFIFKAGPAYVSQTLHIDSKNIGKKVFNAMGERSNTKTKILPKIAIGCGYDFFQHLGVNFIYSHIFGKSAEEANPDNPYGIPDGDMNAIASVNTFQFGATYHFAV